MRYGGAGTVGSQTAECGIDDGGYTRGSGGAEVRGCCAGDVGYAEDVCCVLVQDFLLALDGLAWASQERTGGKYLASSMAPARIYPAALMTWVIVP
jgi:hypothetical protein